jgi:heat shock protein HslJ
VHGIRLFLLIPALTLSLTGCTSDGSAGARPSPASLGGAEWNVTTLDGEPIPAPSKITIQFLENDRVAGNSGCNRFQGSFSMSGGSLSFGPLMGTKRACPEPQMSLESRFLGLMQEVTSAELTTDGALVLKTSDGKRILAQR